MTRLHRWMYPIILVVGFGSGIAFSIYVHVPRLYPRYVPLQVDDERRPEWPADHVIVGIRVDIYLWVVEPYHRYKLEILRDDPNPHRRAALQEMIRCIRESVPTKAPMSLDQVGKVQILLTEGRVIWMTTRQYTYLRVGASNPVDLVWNAEEFEYLVRNNGELVSKTFAGEIE